MGGNITDGDYVLSCVQIFVTLWTVAHQAPLSRGFSRQDYWSELSFPAPGDLPDPGIEPVSLGSPALASGFFTTAPPEKLPTIDKAFIKSWGNQVAKMHCMKVL